MLDWHSKGYVPPPPFTPSQEESIKQVPRFPTFKVGDVVKKVQDIWSDDRYLVLQVPEINGGPYVISPVLGASFPLWVMGEEVYQADEIEEEINQNNKLGLPGPLTEPVRKHAGVIPGSYTLAIEEE
jgi:hypothetical protein